MVIKVHGWTVYKICAWSIQWIKLSINREKFYWSRCNLMPWSNRITYISACIEITCGLTLYFTNYKFYEDSIVNSIFLYWFFKSFFVFIFYESFTQKKYYHFVVWRTKTVFINSLLLSSIGKGILSEEKNYLLIF